MSGFPADVRPNSHKLLIGQRFKRVDGFRNPCSTSDCNDGFGVQYVRTDHLLVDSSRSADVVIGHSQKLRAAWRARSIASEPS